MLNDEFLCVFIGLFWKGIGKLEIEEELVPYLGHHS
jgi:hypothetical protein